MYVPTQFAANLATADQLIRDHPFALLISATDTGAEVSHLPLLADLDADGRIVRLIGHMARGNPQWRDLAGRIVTAVFQGAHAYVSPTWYATSPAVPTWNYSAVHVTGRYLPVDDHDLTLETLRRLSRVFEPADGWTVEGMPIPFRDGMMKGLVAFEIAVDRVEAKAKLSQNRSTADRLGVIDGLRRSGRADAADLASAMAALEG